MIGELIFSLILGIIAGFLIWKFKKAYDHKKATSNIIKKIQKQDKKFLYGGKPIKYGLDELDNISDVDDGLDKAEMQEKAETIANDKTTQ